MEPRWDIAAVVVAIIAVPFAMSPAATTLLASLFHLLTRTLWLAKARCERLEWIDVPDGVLHECTIPNENCEHIRAATRKESWNSTIGTFYTRIRRGNFVKKPRQLELHTEYVRTDYKTLKAMALLLQTYNYDEIPYPDVVFKKVGTVWTAYIKATTVTSFSKDYRLNVTKTEMEGFLRGYPPWYSQPLVLANGHKISHLIRNTDDVSRGGWIVAIGLSEDSLIANDSMDYTLVGNKPKGPIINALLRIHHCLTNIAKAFPDEEIVGEAENLMQRCIALDFCHTGSGLFHIFKASELSNRFGTSKRWFLDLEGTRLVASTLSDAQCILIMRVFSQYDELSLEDIQDLRPVLEIAIRIAMTSAYTVLKFLRPMTFYIDRRTKFDWLEEIKSRSIYLRDRFEDEDI